MSTSNTTKPVQLQLEGLETVHPLIRQGDLDPRFILSDETCRIGLRHIAEIRQRLGVAPRSKAA
jgi:hypothetical protein